MLERALGQCCILTSTLQFSTLLPQPVFVSKKCQSTSVRTSNCRELGVQCVVGGGAVAV